MPRHFEFIVIGSGAGGAPIATQLAAEGRSVLVLEKGPLLRTQGENGQRVSDFRRDEMFNVGTEKRIMIPGVANYQQSFYCSPVEPDLNDEPHIYSKPDDLGTQIVTIEGYTAQVVGGGTQLYGAVSLRFAEDDFRLKSFNEGRAGSLGNDPNGDALAGVMDWPISYDDMLPYYEKTERLVGINGTVNGQAKPFDATDTYQNPLDPNPISAFAKAGMEAQGFEVYRTPLAVITEDHAPSNRMVPQGIDAPKTGYVNRYGDPMGYKSNTWVSLLRPAMEANDTLELWPNCHVTHLSSKDDKVTGVHFRDVNGDEQTVSANVVVVACSAIESVRLMLNSSEQDREGFGVRMRAFESNSLLGAYFLTHCFGGAEVTVFETDTNGHRKHFDKSISLDSDYATDALVNPSFLHDENLWAGGAIYNNTSDQALPIALARNHGSSDLDTTWRGFAGDASIRGDQFTKWLDRDFGTRLSVSFMANQVPVRMNRIQLSNIRDKWGRKSAHVIKDWHPHDAYLMGKFAEICRKILRDGVPQETRDSLDAYIQLPDHEKGPRRFEFAQIESGSVYGAGVRIANHILGGMRFGTDPQTSVLDPNCRVWNFDNLYVTDGAFMPTSGSGNPTLTIQANAYRVADHLKTR